MNLVFYQVDVVNLTDVARVLKENGAPFLTAKDPDGKNYIAVEASETAKNIIGTISPPLVEIEAVDFNLKTGEVSRTPSEETVEVEVVETDVEPAVAPQPIVDVKEQLPLILAETEPDETVPNSKRTELLYVAGKAFDDKLATFNNLTTEEMVGLLPEDRQLELQREVFKYFKLLSNMHLRRGDLLESLVDDLEKRDDLGNYGLTQATADVEELLANNYADYQGLSELSDKFEGWVVEAVDAGMPYVDDEEEVASDDNDGKTDDIDAQFAAFYGKIVPDQGNSPEPVGQEVETDEPDKNKEETMARETYTDENGVTMSRIVTEKKKSKKAKEELPEEPPVTEEKPLEDEDNVEEVQVEETEEDEDEIRQLEKQLEQLKKQKKAEKAKAKTKKTKAKKSKKGKSKRKALVIGLVSSVVLLTAVSGAVVLNAVSRANEAETAQSVPADQSTDQASSSSSSRTEQSTSAPSSSSQDKVTASSSSQKATSETKPTAEIVEEDYLLTEEEHKDYLKRLDAIGSGIYLNDDGTLGGELKFSNGETKRIAEFNRNGELVMEDGTKYELATVQGFLKRVENGR